MNLSYRRVIAVSAAVLAMAAAATLLVAGPLNPPGGLVSSTMKTLAEVEPRIAINASNTPGDTDSVYKITQPGSYYLTASLAGQVGKSGIEIILASQGAVTIDLSGFELIGGADSLSGIVVAGANPTRVSLRDGTIRFWEQGGANLATVVGATIENVRFLNNYATGLSTTKSIIRNCEASSNSGHGMAVDDGSVLENCVACLNTQHGLYADQDCTVHGGEFSNNTQAGVYFEYQGRIANANAANNGVYGISLTRYGTAEACTVTGNGSSGIYVQSGLVKGCSAKANGYGFNGSWTHFESCTANDNTIGIYLNGGSTAVHCLSNSNNSHGIDGGGGVAVLNCKSQYNGGDGIRLSLDGNTVRGNTCIANATSTDGAGIHMLTTDSVVEGNRVTGSDRGIDIDSAGNVIIGNWCSGNTINWQFALNNIYGPIVDRAGAATAAVNGNSAASSMGTTDPHANVTY